MCFVFWLFWLSCHYLPSDWLERLLWRKLWRRNLIHKKTKPKSIYDFLGLLYCFIVLWCVCLVPWRWVIHFILLWPGIALALLVLVLALAIGGLAFHVRASRSCSKQAWLHEWIINIEYFAVFNILVWITNVHTSLTMSSMILRILFTYLLTEVSFMLKLLAWSSCGLGLGLSLGLSWLALALRDVLGLGGTRPWSWPVLGVELAVLGLEGCVRVRGNTSLVLACPWGWAGCPWPWGMC